MSSAVYFKFKASIKQYTIPFDGSAISVKDLRSAIRLSCGLKSTDFELQILDKQGKGKYKFYFIFCTANYYRIFKGGGFNTKIFWLSC